MKDGQAKLVGWLVGIVCWIGLETFIPKDWDEGNPVRAAAILASIFVGMSAYKGNKPDQPSHVPSRCALCREVRELRSSHFMPAALYPKNKKKALATRTVSILNPDQIEAPLLCDECEQRFNRNGESEVLRWIAPKAKTGASPLQEALRQTPDWTHPDEAEDLSCHFSSSLGISAEQFAYFALSLVWRASVYAWPMPNGNRTTPLELGEFSEPVRLFLLGRGSFPDQTFITLTVCSDEKSQEYWMPPTLSGEPDGLIVVPINGALFRVWFGPASPFHPMGIFFPSQDHPVFRTHCWDVLSKGLSPLFAT